MRCEDCDLLSFFFRSPTEYGIRNIKDLSHRVKVLAAKGLGVKSKEVFTHLASYLTFFSEIIRELFGGEHGFAQLTNGQYSTENLVSSVLKMES
jgi:hypothetical protein